MRKLILIFLEQHKEELVPAMIGGGSFAALLTGIDLILKILIGGATLIYFYFKIRNELKK